MIDDHMMYSADDAARIIRAARSLADVLLSRTLGYHNIMTAMPEIGAALDGVIAALDSADVAYFQRLRGADNGASLHALALAVIRWQDCPNRHALAEHGSIGFAPVFARREDAEAAFPGAAILDIDVARAQRA